MEKIVVIMHVLFPGEAAWEEVSRQQVASFKDCRIVQRAMAKQESSLPFITTCLDENLVYDGPRWMRTSKDDIVEKTTTVKKGARK